MMRSARLRQLLDELAADVDPAELAARASLIEDQASLLTPIWDDADLDAAIHDAAERLAIRHGLQLTEPVAERTVDHAGCPAHNDQGKILEESRIEEVDAWF